MFASKKSKHGEPQAQPALAPQQVAALTVAVAEYIRAQQTTYYPFSAPLSFTQIWSRFFSDVDLQRIRAVQAASLDGAGIARNAALERVPNPPFYAGLEQLGFTALPDFSTMAAITFDDVVVFHEPLTPQLIFHELVHVVQYRLLGVDEFARLYVRGYLQGGYHGIPLEICAYELDGRFIMGSVGFDVEAEVLAWIEDDRF